MSPQDRLGFISALDLVGEEAIRSHLEAGHYRGKMWEERLPIIREWLERQAWRRVAWLN